MEKPKRAPVCLALLAIAVSACGGGGGGSGSGNSGGGTGGGPGGSSVPTVTTTGTASNNSAYRLRVLSIPSLDLIADDGRGVIYLAVPSTSTINPSSVSILNPATAKIEAKQTLTAVSSRLAMSRDGSSLYASLTGPGTVQKLSLPSLLTSPAFPIGTNGAGTPYYAIQIIPHPTLAQTVAVVRGDRDSATKGIGGLGIFDNGVMRPKVSKDVVVDAAEWSADAATIYTSNVESSSMDSMVLAVSADGLSVQSQLWHGFLNGALDMHLVDGLLYGSGGDAVQPPSFQPKGYFPAPLNGLLVPPTSAVRTVFRLYPDSTSSDPNNNFVLTSYDADRYSPIASIKIPDVRAATDGFPTALVRWGDRGLAFATSGGRVFLIDGDFVVSRDRFNVVPTISQLPDVVSEGGQIAKIWRVGILAGDMAWDASRGVFYLSMPGTSSFNPNTVTTFDPATREFKNASHVGSDPGQVAISSDGSFLYVGQDGASSVQRFVLPALTQDAQFGLGRDPIFGPYFALRLAPAPGLPRTVAVTRGRPLHPSPEADGVAIYDDAVRRPMLGGHLSTDVDAGNVGYLNGPLTFAIAWSADGSTLFGGDIEMSGAPFSVYSVDASGPSFQRVIDMIRAAGPRFVVDGNTVYDDAGRIFSLATEQLVATVDVGYGSGINSSTGTVESAAGRHFYVSSTTQSGIPNAVYGIRSFRTSDHFKIDAISIYEPREVGASPLVKVRKIVRWGSDGLAFLNDDGALFLVQGPFVSTPP